MTKPGEAVPTEFTDVSTSASHNEASSQDVFNFKSYLDRSNNKTRKSIAFLTSLVLIISSIILFSLVERALRDTKNSDDDKLGKSKPLELRLYSHNIRYDNPYLERGEHFWSERKHLMTSSIKFHTENTGSSVIGLQEVLHNQLEDILSILNEDAEEWGYYGIGRKDGKKEGEFGPILYKKSEWTLLENRTFWLSETPDVPSIGWDSVLERIVTMVTLQSKQSPSHVINVFCTHFDHVGVIGRRESAKLIIDRMENYNDYPSFLLGDFNTQPTDEPYQILKKHGMQDSRTLATPRQSYGHNSTFTGFDNNNEANTIIDYIWAPYWSTNGTTPYSNAANASPNKTLRHNIRLRSYGVPHSHFGFYMSDHRPVVALYELS